MGPVIQSYEIKLGGTNPYRQIKVRSRDSRSHELSSHGWDVVRSLQLQSPQNPGTIESVFLLNPAACLFLGAGIPPEMGGRFPFAFGNVWATPRNLFLLKRKIADGEFVFMTVEDEERFAKESERFASEILAVQKEIDPGSAEAEAEATAPKRTRSKGTASVASELASAPEVAVEG